nr:hypothetical protein [Tanacetum cinerariifolium]
MPYPRFTKVIIYYLLSKHDSISKRQGSYINTFREDGVLGRLFISKGELTQVYGMYIPDEIMNDEIKNSMAYQTYLALYTGTKPLKKGRGKGKGLMGKKAATPAPEKKKSFPKKIGQITAEENILSDSDEVLQLGESGTPKSREDYIIQQIYKGSSEGSGSKPEVSDEPKSKSIGSSEELVLHQSDDERTESEKEAIKSEKADEQTADEEEVHSDDEHDDSKVPDDEKEDEKMVDAEKVDAKKSKEEKVENEQARDGQADKDDHAKFLNLSFDVSLVATIRETADTEINSLPLTPLPTPPTITEAQATVISVPDPSPTVFKRLSELENKVEALSKVDYSKATEESLHTISSTRSRTNCLTESLFEYELKKILFDKMDKSCSYMTHDEAIASGEANPDKLLRKRHRDEDQDPPADSDKEKKRNSLTFDVLMVTPIDFSKFAINRLKLDKITKADLVGHVYKLLKGTCKSIIELEYNMDQCYIAQTDQLDWINPEGDRCPYNLSKPLPLQGSPAARYELKFIEEMIPRKWSPVKVAYNMDAKLGICYWGLRQIVVRRADRKEYRFKEGNFKRLHLNDIEDMLLLHVQNKLFNIPGDDIVNLVIALPTCSLVASSSRKESKMYKLE